LSRFRAWRTSMLSMRAAAEPLPRINSSSRISSPQPNHFDCAPDRIFTGGHWLEAPCLKLLQQFL
jgi:hypothetical protein